MLPAIFLYIVVFLYGIVIGSFLNVLIYRIPKKENIVTTRSHCMNCGYQLRWYDLVPLFSYLALGGRCRKCKAHISVQYPVIEALNGVLYLLVFWKYGMSVDSLVYCLLFSTLLALSVIDFRTYEIPVGFNLFILALGLIHGAFHYTKWLDFLIGFLCVSVFLLILYYATGGRGSFASGIFDVLCVSTPLLMVGVITKGAFGGGDVKLMAVCGLLLGWKLIIFAFLLGCIIGSVIHLIRMKVSGEGHVLAMGPYLSAGVAIAVLWGNEFLQWYLHFYL